MKRQAGFLMVELAMALAVLAVGVLAFLGSYYSNFRSFNTIRELDEAHFALESVSELLRGEAVDQVYEKHHGTFREVATLKGPDGEPAKVEIRCYVDESAIPPEFGPIVDLDGNPGKVATDVSGGYSLLPVHLKLTYQATHGVETREVYLVIGIDATP